MSNINHRFEQLIDRISIKNGKKEYIKGQVKYLTRHLKAISNEPVVQYYNSHYPVLDFKLLQFNYGGSFDRNTCIKKKYDIDAYLVYIKKPDDWSSYSFTGGNLFELACNHLKTFKANFSVDLKIRKPFPYTHAIPIRINFKDQALYVDCIPAILYEDDTLLVPNGMDDTHFVNPNLDLEVLSSLNHHYDGRITKLILLIKYWNYHWNKPLKSYLIERLIIEIFENDGLNEWDRAIKTFFNRAMNLLNRDNNNELVLENRLYPNHTILEDYDDPQLDTFYDILNKAHNFAVEEKWDKLFGQF